MQQSYVFQAVFYKAKWEPALSMLNVKSWSQEIVHLVIVAARKKIFLFIEFCFPKFGRNQEFGKGTYLAA